MPHPERHEGVTSAPTIGAALSLAELTADPYPSYRRLREQEPVAWVPAANRYFVTRYKDALQIERQPQLFSSVESNSLMLRAVGSTMLRLDGADHKRLRSAIEPSLRQGTIRSLWLARYQQIVDDLIDGLIDRGQMNLVEDFAAPCAAACLALLLGLHDTTQTELQRWSQGVIDGSGNYGDDPVIWARAAAARAEVESALRAIIPVLRKEPDGSIVSALLQSTEAFSVEEIRNNVMITIGGGINEPRDVIATATYALLTQPDQRALVAADESLWMAVFDEALRWVSPVGMYPRQTTQSVELGGRELDAGARIGVIVASANRDEETFQNADVFDIRRPKRPHLAFGGGPHYCLGAWAARAQVAQCALPTLFRRLTNLRLVSEPPVVWQGWVFRGPTSLPLAWDP
jgi:cytochrome P450